MAKKVVTGEQITVRIPEEHKKLAERLHQVVSSGNNDLSRLGVTITHIYRVALARGLESLALEYLERKTED